MLIDYETLELRIMADLIEKGEAPEWLSKQAKRDEMIEQIEKDIGRVSYCLTYRCETLIVTPAHVTKYGKRALLAWDCNAEQIRELYIDDIESIDPIPRIDFSITKAFDHVLGGRNRPALYGFDMGRFNKDLK